MPTSLLCGTTKIPGEKMPLPNSRIPILDGMPVISATGEMLQPNYSTLGV